MNVTILLDMRGCPNRCRHCWLGHMPNKKLADSDAEFVVKKLEKYFDNVRFYSWLRELDYFDDYRERWKKDKELSKGSMPERFELASFYKIVREADYVRFLKETGVKKVQLTLFGLEDMTDKYVGRKGAFEEIIKATDILISNGIAPRWQAFINEENKEDIELVIKLIEEKKFKKRCQDFEFFIHEGSCDGENAKLYDIRINKENINEVIKMYFLEYDAKLTESECCEILKDMKSPFIPKNDGDIVLNVTNDFDVYYNFTGIAPAWRIGNLREDNIDELVQKIQTGDTFALNKAREISIGELVQLFGDFHSHKIFEPEDYKMYLLNRFLDREFREIAYEN